MGLALTALGLAGVRLIVSESTARLTHLSLSDIAIALGLAVCATTVAGLYPTWRAAHVRPRPGNPKLNGESTVELAIILKSLRRNKIGAVVIAVQIAVTLAILCNALFIIQQRLAASHRPSGVDEADLFILKNQWIGDAKDLPARLRTDLDALRGLGGVVDAYATNSVPLSNGGDSEGLGRDPAGVGGDGANGDVLRSRARAHDVGRQAHRGTQFPAG